MARIKRAAPCTGTPFDVNRTRLPLALKPSNSTISHSSSSSSQELSPTTTKINTNPVLSLASQPSSSLLLAKKTKISSTAFARERGTMMKKTKSISKAQIIESKLDDEDKNTESDSEGQYDLTTSIEESGGIEKFLETPCMILYKRNLTNQVDLENYILKHLSSYSTNQCLFAGIKGSDELKIKINQFYHENRKKSKNSTIIFQAYSSRTTMTQQILLKKGNLYLFVDGMMKRKTFKNRRKKVSAGSARGGERINPMKHSDSGAKCGIGHSGKNLQHVQSGDQSDDEEKSDIENLDGGGNDAFNNATSEIEEGDEEQGKDVSEVESEEETSRTNNSSGVKKRKDIRWKGGAKNTGIYQLLNKHEEVRECLHSVLSYGREHGVLLSGVQLKSLMDIENVEMTKDRATALVELISRNVEIVNNPHFVAPTAQKPLFEYYGENFELSEVVPAASIPIPRTIMIKYKKDKSKKERADDRNQLGTEKKDETSMNAHKAVSGETAQERASQNREDEGVNQIAQAGKENLNGNETSLVDDQHSNKNQNQNQNLNKNDSKNGHHKVEIVVHQEDIVADASLLSEECPIHDDNDGIDSGQIESTPQRIIERCSSPLPGKTHSSITINTISEISPVPSADCIISNKTLDTATNASPLVQRKNTKLQQESKNIPVKKVNTAKLKTINSKRRSFALRSKTKKKRQPSVTTSNEPKRKDQHMGAGSSIQSKKRKVNDNENSAEQYRTLTKQIGKIPKKHQTS